MTTTKQAAANRQNALLSTGPTTAAGKAAASTNALKHGLLSTVPVLPDEDEQAYGDLLARLYDELGPVGAIEAAMVDNIAFLLWRLERARRIDREVFIACYYDHQLRTNEANDAAVFSVSKDDEDNKQLRSKRDGELSIAAKALTTFGDRITNLGRYEAALERRLFKAAAELKARQAGRVEAA
jgi:hypothetical protein